MAIRTCVVALLLLAVAAPVSAQRKPAPEAEVCKNCHADYVQSYFETKHGQVGNVKGPDCQTCHGNADAHADCDEQDQEEQYPADADGRFRRKLSALFQCRGRHEADKCEQQTEALLDDA